MTRVYQHNPFFDTTELSTKHTGHQERRMEIARAEIFPDGVPTGLHVAQFNGMVVAGAKSILQHEGGDIHSVEEIGKLPAFVIESQHSVTAARSNQNGGASPAPL